jgi:hypothetical protein
MEKEIDATEIKYKNMYVAICVTQTVCLAVILITVLIVKMFFDNSYIKLKSWCEQNILEQTVITAAFDEEY